jgi:inner membrane protein
LDNLTHTLVGVIAGEALARSTPANPSGLPSAERRGLFITLCAVGGNLPDLDLLYSYRGFTGNKLGYLLEHRGYTHTVVGCVVLGLLLYVAAECWIRWRHLTPARQDRLQLLGVSLFATLLHLAMDALNSYGVHPLWPFENRWYYGDSVFILEPLYWLAAAPLLFVLRSTIARVLLGLLVLAGFAVCILVHLTQPLWCAAIVLLAVGLLVLGRQTDARAAALSSATAVVGLTLVFIVTGRLAAQRVELMAREYFPADRIIDHVLTPMPANPLCWDVLLLQTHGDRYSARHGVLSEAPRLLDASRCSATAAPGRTVAPMANVSAPDTADMRWLGEFSMSRAQLVRLVGQHCEAAALMRFARAPFATVVDQLWVIGDLRFDRGTQLGMAAVALAGPPAADPCGPRVPWVPPRQDLLREADFAQPER